MRNGRYASIHLHMQADGHKDREVWRWGEAIHPDAYLSGLSGLSGVCRLSVGSVHFGSFRLSD